MIVYGDHRHIAETGPLLGAIDEALARTAAMPAGIARHGALVSVFVRLAAVIQGVADAAFEIDGVDRHGPAEHQLLTHAATVAKAIILSWDSDFQYLPSLPRNDPPPDLPARIEVRAAEGHAFYAVYPEAYALAARQLDLTGSPQVIGIRSIGTGLATIAAAALGAPPPLTVRPVGHPFDRRLSLSDDLAQRLIRPAAHYVIVDEGPGLSGSSFAAVAEFLESRGIDRRHIAFLPSHAGEPGPRASERTRQRWVDVARPVISFETLIPSERLADWATALLGPLDGPPEDISGGGWRRHRHAREADWPAVDAMQERRKFLLRAKGESWLMKFAGLGEEGERKLHRGRLLDRAGLVPEVRGLVHGFLIQRWIESRTAMPTVTELAHYLSTRARLLPAPNRPGASLRQLVEMTEFNVGASLGSEAASRLGARLALDEMEAVSSHPIAIDGRMDRCEWLRAADGRLLKADALDHDLSHDLIGAQDIAWDAVGARVELDLDTSWFELLLSMLDRQMDRPVSRALTDLMLPIYLAFRLGASTLAADTLVGWPAEAERNRQRAQGYGDRLLRLLSTASPATETIAKVMS